MKTNRIIGLDLLRVFAAVGILMYHYFFIGPLQGLYSMNTFIEGAFWGEFGVDVFFILSGYSILFSLQGKTRKEFIISRVKRIYPAFFLCSSFTLFCGFLMPDVSKKDLLFKYLLDFTFVQDIFGVSPLSSVYWTLMVEMKFYILIVLIAWTKVWRKNYHYIVVPWLLVSIVNTFLLHNKLLEIVLLTKYAGHFVTGMAIYSINHNSYSKLSIAEVLLSSILIWNNCMSFATWILSVYNGNMTGIRIFIPVLVVVMVSVFYSLTKIKKISSGGRLVTYMSACSYVFYLIHADLGYFCRTQWYVRVLPFLLEANILKNGFLTSEPLLMLGIIIIVFIISAIFNKLLNLKYN